MKTQEEVMSKHKDTWGSTFSCDWNDSSVKAAMNEFAKEVLEDFDNWKAHKTPDLVKLYIKEKGL